MKPNMNSHESAAPSQPINTSECCMCGDYGLPYELFRCKVCLFRSQHRYCSDLYPKADSYRVCNWCLKKKEGTQQNSSLSSSTHKKEDDNKIKNKKIINSSDGNDNRVSLKVQRGNLQFYLNNPIKKQKPTEQLPPVRKKIISTDCTDEIIGRTKSEEFPNPGITKQVVKGKVRRYKLLDEVFS